MLYALFEGENTLNIFINYRRTDSQYQVDRLFEELSTYLEAPEQQLYMDIETTPLGIDYIDYIQKKIRESDVFLTVIGDEWLTTPDINSGQPRLQNPEDLVRQEIAFSLNQDIPVIPTLLDQAIFPKPKELPDDIAALTRRNGVTIKRRTFEEDVHALAEGLGLTGENRKAGVYFLPPLLGGEIVSPETKPRKRTDKKTDNIQTSSLAKTSGKRAVLSGAMIKIMLITVLAVVGVVAVALTWTSPPTPVTSKWSPWYDVDNPSGDGDFETVTGMVAQGRGCPSPTNIQCRLTRTKTDWTQAGQVYTCDTQAGGHCRNKLQPSFSPTNYTVCKDYEVRVYCPIK